jgi:pheromone shutdown-related protein TraB
MIRYENIALVGTSHIAKQSIEDIKDAFNEVTPDIIAIELDEPRLHGLIAKSRGHTRSSIRFSDVFKIGIKGVIFSLIGSYVEEKLGQSVGVSPGTDMLTAYNLARQNRKQLALIDQDIGITLKKLSKSISWREKWHFLVDIFKAVVLRKKEVESFDLETVPSKKIISKMIAKVKMRYPNIYKILVKERNEYMGKKLALIMKHNPNERILAVIGAGHEEEMLDIIKQKIRNIDVVYTNSFIIHND